MGIDLKHRAASDRASEIAARLCGAIEVARCVPDHARIWISPIRLSGKAVKRLLFPSGSQLEHRSRVEPPTTKLSGAVEVACSVVDQSSARKASVLYLRKRMEHGERLRLCRGQDRRERKHDHQRQPAVTQLFPRSFRRVREG